MSDKAKQVLSWIFGIAAIIFICMKDSSKDVKFVCAQSIVLWVIEIVGGNILGLIPGIGGFLSIIIYIASIVIWVLGLIKICQDKQGDELEIPIIGSLAKSIFGKAI